jgi:hypothetical protein
MTFQSVLVQRGPKCIRHIVLDTASQETNQLMVAAESLNHCQKSLFNAGDDFVELVMNYVGAEDDALAATNPRAYQIER